MQVRGTCPKCAHVVTTEAPKDRVTWRGDCPVKECPGKVIARRFESTTPASADAPSTGTAPARRSTVQRVRTEHVPADSAAASVPAADSGSGAAGGPAA